MTTIPVRDDATDARVGDGAAYFALAVLTLLNLLNYVDRFIFAALIPYIKADTGYTDAQLGMIGSAFTWVYTICSPTFGFLGDRHHRGRLIAAGIAVWSLATAGAGVSRTFGQMLVARSAVGIGEANYATIAPSLLSDFFTKARRGLAMSVFFATIPIGTAVGYVVGGTYGAPESVGWRNTLYLVGFPGLIAAFMMFAIREPKRGAMDEPEETRNAEAVIPWKEGYVRLLKNQGYVFACLGYAAVTFAVGALVFWAPQWMTADKGLTEKQANDTLGVCAVVGGSLGTLVGGVIGDALNRRMRGGYFLVCAVCAPLSAIPVFIALAAKTPIVYQGCIFLGIAIIFCANGPVNTLVVNLVPPNLRTTATGLVVVFIHLLGDGISVGLVGGISTFIRDTTDDGRPLPTFVSKIASLFFMHPTQTLSIGLIVTPFALLAGGVFYALGMRAERRAAQA
jgi:MFS transporter, Spinster family, sphingosine-1-phosphate transporter